MARERQTCIKGILAKLFTKFHEVTFSEVDLIRQTSLPGLLVGSLNLEVVIVETGDVRIGESTDFSGRCADATTDIKDAHVRFDTHHIGDVMFVTGKLDIISYDSDYRA